MIMLSIWMDFLGMDTLFNLNMGFWVSMSAVIVLVILMNVIFWSMKPKNRS